MIKLKITKLMADNCWKCTALNISSSKSHFYAGVRGWKQCVKPYRSDSVIRKSSSRCSLMFHDKVWAPLWSDNGISSWSGNLAMRLICKYLWYPLTSAGKLSNLLYFCLKYVYTTNDMIFKELCDQRKTLVLKICALLASSPSSFSL